MYEEVYLGLETDDYKELYIEGRKISCRMLITKSCISISLMI
jgi:hypothetical protein